MAQQPVLVSVVSIEIDRLSAELQIQLVATDPSEVIALRVVEEVVDESTR